MIVNVLTEFLAFNVTATVLSRRTAKTANGVGLFGPITSRCQTNIETGSREVQHTGIFYLQNLTRLCITQDRRFLAIGVIG